MYSQQLEDDPAKPEDRSADVHMEIALLILRTDSQQVDDDPAKPEDRSTDVHVEIKTTVSCSSEVATFNQSAHG